MAELPFVDTHVHFWDLKHPDLRYVWLAPDFVHPQIGDIDAIKFELYDAERFVEESRPANTVKAVHVQAAIGSDDPVKETEWLQQAADRTGFPHGIVAYTNLKDPRAEEELERHARFANLRGIRDFSEGDYLVDPDFARGYALLERFDLVCDLDCLWEDMPKARDLARRFPATTMVLDHAGFPQERSDEYFRAWRGGLAALAEAENAVVKISGLGMKDPQWTVDSIRPWLLACVEAFGVERSFLGTNWPVDRLYSDYGTLVDAYAELVADFSRDEQEALFFRNAERIYRI